MTDQATLCLDNWPHTYGFAFWIKMGQFLSFLFVMLYPRVASPIYKSVQIPHKLFLRSFHRYTYHNFLR